MNTPNTKLQKFTNTLSSLFLLCLWLLAFQSIFWQVIFDFDLASYKFWAVILNLIKTSQYTLVILAIVFGSLIFYVNRDKIESVEKIKDISDKKAYMLLFLIMVTWLIVKYYLSMHLNLNTDETYTYMVIEWFNKFWKIWITPSWVIYENNSHIIFHYLTTIFYNFFYENWFNKLFSLRSFNIIFSTLLLIPLFYLIINWFLNITFMTARSYVLFWIGSVIVSILFIYGILKKAIHISNLFSFK